MRKPDEQISDYMSRWYLIPHNRWFNIYLHRFTRSDDDRALHDHPWWSVSFLLKGMLFEHSFVHDTWWGINIGSRYISTCLPIFRSAKFAHRLELLSPEVWTLFITGPKTREWGFHTSKGWVHHDKF